MNPAIDLRGNFWLNGLDEAEHQELAGALEAAAGHNSRRKLSDYYPDTGPLRRALYPQHLEFFRAGATHRQRCAMFANRTGKTEGCGGYETALHLTGLYPHWWEGRRWDRPIDAWAAGKTNETTRDIIQKKLFGPVVWEGNRRRVSGVGLVPGEHVGLVSWKAGVTGLLDEIKVRHVPTGGWSTLGLKCYEQGRGAFEGTYKDLIWPDEEPPEDVYGEMLIRTMGTDGEESEEGIIMLTFTPLEGMSKVVLGFMPKDMRPEVL